MNIRVGFVAKNSNGSPFYTAYAAQELVEQFSEEIGIKPLHYNQFVYLAEEDRYEEKSRISEGIKTSDISGTELRQQFLRIGRPPPPWFTRPEVAEILTQTFPPRHKQGVCIWFTGLSGAGKSTTADVLTVLLQECGRQVTVLDGDVVRLNLSRGLGFSREDRDLNIRRIGFVASEIVRHGGAVVCAALSPYRSTRNEVRSMVGVDRFVEVFVDTPLEECERRDTKGLYARARRGEIKNFTGIDDPYEPPGIPRSHWKQSAPLLKKMLASFSRIYGARVLLKTIKANLFVARPTGNGIVWRIDAEVQRTIVPAEETDQV